MMVHTKISENSGVPSASTTQLVKELLFGGFLEVKNVNFEWAIKQSQLKTITTQNDVDRPHVEYACIIWTIWSFHLYRGNEILLKSVWNLI